MNASGEPPKPGEGNEPPGRETPQPEEAVPLPPARRGEERGWFRRLRRDAFVQLLLYYAALTGVVALLAYLVPTVRLVFDPVFLPATQGGTELFQAPSLELPAQASPDLLRSVVDRSLTTFLVIVGALALVVPVAGVYMKTKRLQFDPALVRSVVILPIVVAGIALVVKNSIALAFSLAGIVAAVRFRNTLKDPRDAVYIFLTIAIGLSAGVQALDVALVMSMLFNFVVLGLWRFNVGSIYGGRYGRTGVLSSGDPNLLVAQAPRDRNRIRRSLLPHAGDEETDGILLVHVVEPELARYAVQEALGDTAKDWRLVRIVPRGDELSTLEYLVQLKKKSTPADVVGALGERWSHQVLASEYVPFRLRKNPRPDGVAPDAE